MSTTIILPCRNEAGTVVELLKLVLNSLNSHDEVIVVEGGSSDETWTKVQSFVNDRQKVRLLKQEGQGKFDAVLFGIKHATSEYIMVWDADGTVDIEDNLAIYEFSSKKDYFITGDRLYGVREIGSMRYFNYLANWFFAIWWGRLLNRKPTDSLCGSKKFPKDIFRGAPSWLLEKDPYGDFSMLAMARFRNLEFNSYPVRYKARKYGKTNIRRWEGGIMLLKLILRISVFICSPKERQNDL